MSSRVSLRVRQLRRLLEVRELRVGISTVLLGVAIILTFVVVFPSMAPEVGLDLALTFIAAVAGVNISHALIVRRVAKTDVDRIDPAADVCDRYEDRADLLTTDRLASIDPQYDNRLPAVVDQTVFSGFDPWPAVEPSGVTHELPASIEAFLEPRYDTIVSRFNNEGKSNRSLVRLDAFDDGTAHVSETTYFRSYLTNISPDFTPEGGQVSLREAHDYKLFDEAGLGSMASSPFSNPLGGGGLIVTTDGGTIVGVRRFDATVSERELADSFGGDFAYKNFKRDGLRGALLGELDDEVTPVTPDDVRAVYGLGFVRRLDWLGHPNFYSVVLVDAPDGITHSGTDHLETLSADFDVSEPVTGDALSDPEFARTAISELLAVCEDSQHSLGTTLMAVLELWLRQCEEPA